MRERYPAVPQLSTRQLRDWLAAAGRAQPLLLDARARSTRLSHLQGERQVSDLGAALRALEGRAKDAPVVVYWSVGVRSSALADSLIREGWRNVSNLEGSLFESANLGLPMVRGAEAAANMHPLRQALGYAASAPPVFRILAMTTTVDPKPAP